MIIIRLIGGLGNQMFQYALGRHLAERRSAALKIDISGFETYPMRKYALGPFSLRESFASPQEVAVLRGPERTFGTRLVQALLRRPVAPTSRRVREKARFEFDLGILGLPDGVYLEGSWQNEKYFRDIAGIIRQEFTVKSPPTGKNRDMSEQIRSCESVSLHIRRGDYVSDPRTNRIHGTCGVEYYYPCVERMAHLLKTPHFFVFGDDLQWARDNLKWPYPMTLVDQNAEDQSHEDLRLMSQCEHHIIANSSFSWWGAWLNPHPKKIVLAPRRWIRGDDYNPEDIIPDGWIMV